MSSDSAHRYCKMLLAMSGWSSSTDGNIQIQQSQKTCPLYPTEQKARDVTPPDDETDDTKDSGRDKAMAEGVGVGWGERHGTGETKSGGEELGRVEEMRGRGERKQRQERNNGTRADRE